MTSASLLIGLIIGIIVGALRGWPFGGSVGELPLTILAGLLGTIIAAVVRDMIMVRGPGVGPDDSRTPLLVIVYSAIASLAGSSTAIEVARFERGLRARLARHLGSALLVDPAGDADGYLPHQSWRAA